MEKVSKDEQKNENPSNKAEEEEESCDEVYAKVAQAPVEGVWKRH